MLVHGEPCWQLRSQKQSSLVPKGKFSVLSIRCYHCDTTLVCLEPAMHSKIFINT